MGTGLTKKYIIYLYKGYSQVGECYWKYIIDWCT
jgi:hypothetical protein